METIEKLQKQMNMMRDEVKTYREQYQQERDNALMLYKALSKHAPDALKEVLPNLWQNTLESDKFMSEASREREKRQRTEWKLETAEAVIDDVYKSSNQPHIIEKARNYLNARR